jgi:hypothetical protein
MGPARTARCSAWGWIWGGGGDGEGVSPDVGLGYDDFVELERFCWCGNGTVGSMLIR